ncbi:MAG: hypothetical protein OXF58_01500, partial [Gammaproteobacteria bacterium]|nr:hypothetical protein [Gammaproteobacteria bacterium]
LLAVSEDTSGGRDFVAANDEGSKQVVIQAGSATATFTVPTTGDSADEPDGTVTLALRTSGAYTSGNPSSATVAVSDDDVPPPPPGLPTVSIDDATAREGQSMVFTARLSAPATNHAFVYVKTRDSSPASATADVDYQANHFSARVVIIHRGSRERQFSIQTHRDAHDDDGETFEVVVTQAWMNASGGARPLPIADGVAIGTITNDDPLPAAYLARFGRTVADQALGGIAGRLEANRTPGLQGTFAGRVGHFGSSAAQPLTDDAGAPHNPAVRGASDHWFGSEAGAPHGRGDLLGARAGGFDPPARTITAQEALLGSSFTLTRQQDSAHGTLAFWGRTSQSRFDGAERGGGNEVTLNGTVTTGMLGLDYARNDWLVGLALTQTWSEGQYASIDGDTLCAKPATDAAAGCDSAPQVGDGNIDASLTAALPYAAWQASERLKVWGAAGYGRGAVTLKTLDERYRADTHWRLAAAGVRGDLLSAYWGGGPALALVSDVLWARTTSDQTHELAASASDVTRLRLGLEGRWPLTLPTGGGLVPKLEIGARHDGGDAETGFGVELGGGFKWTEPRLGLALDLAGRTLLTHEDGDLTDRGLSASLAWDPAPMTRLGPTLSLRQALGGPAQGGLDALFTADPLAARQGRDVHRHWTLEAAYGFPAFGGRFSASPHAGLGQTAGAHDYRLGWRLTPEAKHAPDLSLSLEAVRRAHTIGAPEHRIGAELTIRW